MQRVAAVELSRNVEQFLVVVGHILPLQPGDLGLWVPKDGGLHRLRDNEWPVRVIDRHERDVEVPAGSPTTRVGPVGAGNLLVVGPGHVFRVHPVLRVNWLERVAGRAGHGRREGGADEQQRRDGVVRETRHLGSEYRRLWN